MMVVLVVPAAPAAALIHPPLEYMVVCHVIWIVVHVDSSVVVESLDCLVPLPLPVQSEA